MPAVGRRRGIRRYPPKRVSALHTGRPRGGRHMIEGAPKTHLHTDPSGRKWYGKGDDVFYYRRSKDTRVVSKHKRTKGQPAFKGDLPGQRT